MGVVYWFTDTRCLCPYNIGGEAESQTGNAYIVPSIYLIAFGGAKFKKILFQNI